MTSQTNPPRSQATPTAQQILQRLQEFVGVINTTVEKDNEHRARFPGFKLTSDIVQKLHSVKELVRRGDMEGADRELANATKHFANKQICFTRGLVGVFASEVRCIEGGTCHPEVVEDLREEWMDYRGYVQQSWVDLSKASSLAWNLRNKIDTAHQRSDQLKKRDAEKKLAEQRERIKAKREKQEAETQAGIERHKQRTAQKQERELTETATTMEKILEELEAEVSG